MCWLVRSLNQMREVLVEYHHIASFHGHRFYLFSKVEIILTG